MDKLVSVVVPVYNAEKYIYNCVESIMRQVYKNLEIILIDDGSKDNSALICVILLFLAILTFILTFASVLQMT